jgi:stage II sporulation protein D
MMAARRAVLALLLLSAAACQPGEAPLPVLSPPRAVTPGQEPRVRVGIAVDTPSVMVTAASPFEIFEGPRRLAMSAPDRPWLFTAVDGRLVGRADDGTTVAAAGGSLRLSAGQPYVQIAGRNYRGEVLLRATERNTVTAVNIVDLEAYLLGVVPRELGRRPVEEIEAVKAQAIAARTYAVGNLGGREALGFDFYATVMDQVYGGVQDEDAISSRAVVETRGEIVTHAGRPILAYYSSTCGGRTASIEDSWPWRTPQPYLRSVSDQVPGTDRYYCDTSNRFRWTTRWTRDELLAVLGQTLRAHTGGAVQQVQRVSALDVVAINASERATLRLVADGRDYTLRADSLRWVLRPQPGPAILNSSRIIAVDAAITGGEVRGLEIQGAGWGHAIGMCQVGAMGRARAGQSYRQILAAYYTDTEITQLY